MIAGWCILGRDDLVDLVGWDGSDIEHPVRLVGRAQEKEVAATGGFIAERDSLLTKPVKWMIPPILQKLVGVLVVALDLDPCPNDEHRDKFDNPPGDGVHAPGSKAFGEDGLPVVVVAVAIHAAHVVAW